MIEEHHPRNERPLRVLGRLQPRVPPGGLGGGGLPRARPHRDRRLRRPRHRDHEGDLQSSLPPRDAVRDHGRGLGRADQVRLERVPGRRRSPSSTRSPGSASWWAPTSRTSRPAWASTPGSAPEFLLPGPGFGGSCFPKDTAARGRRRQAARVRLRVDRSDDARQRADQGPHGRKDRGGRGPRSPARRSAVLGLSFKPETDDIRESPALAVVADLLQAGARVRAFDPVAMENTKAVFPQLTYAQRRLRLRRRGRRSSSSRPSGTSSARSIWRARERRSSRRP